MKDYFYDLRYKADNTEWRVRAGRELIFQFWKKYYSNTQKDANILDFGCGTGVLQEQFAKRFKVMAYGIDVSKKAIEYCLKRGLPRVAVYDGKKIPFKENFFDLVIASNVLEHIKYDSRALVEIKRVLRKKGLAFFLVPAHPNLWSTRDINLHHFRRYRVGELENKCEKEGFKILARKNVDFALYFIFSLIHRFASKKSGIARLKMDIATASNNKFLNEVIFFYEQIENKIQNFITFPVGLSIVVVVQKT